MAGINGYHPDTMIVVADELRTLQWCVDNLTDWKLQGIFEELDSLPQFDCPECGCAAMFTGFTPFYESYRCKCGNSFKVN